MWADEDNWTPEGSKPFSHLRSGSTGKHYELFSAAANLAVDGLGLQTTQMPKCEKNWTNIVKKWNGTKDEMRVL